MPFSESPNEQGTTVSLTYSDSMLPPGLSIDPSPIGVIPGIASPASQVARTGESVHLALGLPSDGPSQYSADGLPPGLSIEPLTGIISGTVSEVAGRSTPYSVFVTVYRCNSRFRASSTFQWAIVEAIDPDTPIFKGVG